MVTVQSIALAALTETVRHFALAAGLPALVLLATVAALASAADALAVVGRRAVLAAGWVLAAAALALAGVAAVDGGPAVAPAVVGLATGVATAGAARPSGRLRTPHVAAAAVVVALSVGLALDLRVDAFGWYRRPPVPVQSVALVGAAAAFVPFGFAARRRERARWIPAGAAVVAPFAVVAPAVPVGGLGPFFVAVLLAPWALATSAVGAVLFALGWTAAGRGPDRRTTGGSDP